MSDREQGYYDYLNRISAVVPASLKMYLVGGAVRDLILNKPLHDYRHLSVPSTTMNM